MPQGLLRSFVFALVACASVRQGLRAVGRIMAAAILRDFTVGPLLAAAVTFAACCLACAVAYFLWARIPSRMPAWLVAIATAALFFGTSYANHLRPLSLFEGVATREPNRQGVEHSPVRPPNAWRTNSHGFRGPEWKQSPDGMRIAVVGDSCVWGSGLEYEDTLSQTLERWLVARFPPHRFEALNLGVPGNNLAAHVALLEGGVRRFSPQVAVLFITVGNDLIEWDFQTESLGSSRVSVFSLAAFILGQSPVTVFHMAAAQTPRIDGDNPLLESSAARLENIAARKNGPRIFAFLIGDQSSHEIDSFIRKRLERLPNIVTIGPLFLEETDLLADKAHPSPEGSRRIAAQVGQAFSRDAVFQRMIARQPEPPSAAN